MTRATIGCLVCVLLAPLGLPGGSEAATVLLKDGAAVYCVLVRKEAADIVVNLHDDQGVRIKQSRIPNDQIEDILYTVSNERLGELTPEKPNGYRLYAEELAAKRKDPEARQAAMRLFLIAAHLSPKQLGRSCLLGMAELAPANHVMRYRALAYLACEPKDPKLLKAPTLDEASARQKKLAQLLRALRTRRTTEADRMLEADAQLARAVRSRIAPSAVRELLARSCVHCEKGFVPCPTCNGSGKTSGRPCPACRISSSRSRGSIACAHCGGRYNMPVLSDESLRDVVRWEYELLSGAKLRYGDSWTLKSAEDPARNLRIVSILDFDPANCLFRNGKWVKP